MEATKTTVLLIIQKYSTWSPLAAKKNPEVSSLGGHTGLQNMGNISKEEK